MPPVRRGAPKARSRAQIARQSKEAPQSIDVADVTIEVEDLSTSHHALNILLAGPSGHGKTILASFLPRCVIMSTETAGTLSAKRAGSKARVIHTKLWEHVVAGKKWCDENLGKDDWVVMDSLTKMQVLMVRWILRKQHEDNSSRDLDIPAIQDHQKWQNYFKRFVDSLIDAPYNVVFICGDMIKTDQDGEDIVLPHIEGKDYAICNYVRAQTSVNIYYAVTTELTEEQAEAYGTSSVRRALFQPFPPFVFPKDRTMSMGFYQDVTEGDFGAMAGWVEEMERAILAGALEQPGASAAAAPTPIKAATSRRRRTA